MKKIIITIAILSTLSMPNILLAQEPDPVKETCSGDGLCLNVPIGGKDTVSGLGEYIQLWYTFVIGAVGIMATIIIMYAGFKWLASRGNAGVIQNSKEKIWSAIIGLFLAFASFIILEIINSELVNIGLPNLDTANIQFTNTDGDLDNDRDITEQIQRTLTEISHSSVYDYIPVSPLLPGVSIGDAYDTIDETVEWLYSINDEQVLVNYLESHNISINNNNNILEADPQQIMALTRMGNQFGDIEIDRYLHTGNGGVFILDRNQTDAINRIISADNDGFNSQVIGEGEYSRVRITDVDFDYVASNGQDYHYDLTLTQNNNSDGEWEIRFQ